MCVKSQLIRHMISDGLSADSLSRQMIYHLYIIVFDLIVNPILH